MLYHAASMVRLRAVFVALSLLAMALFVGQMRDTIARPPPATEAPAPRTDARVSVFVGHASEPVANAEVRVIYTDPGGSRIEATATTDASGRASFENLREGAYWILAIPTEGLARGSTSTLLSAVALTEVAIDLAEERVLRVHVEDEQGDPFPDARLEARGEDAYPIAGSTRADGSAELPGFRGARARLRIDAVGYELVTVPAAATVTRDAAPEIGVVRVVLKKLGRLTVTVLGPDGNRLPRASVHVASAVLWPARIASTRDDGTALLLGLPFGSYAIRATHGNDLTASDVVVAVEPGEDPALTVRLVHGQSLVVRVVEGERENAVPKARVTLVEGGLSSFPQTAVTDKSGKATLGPFLGEASISVFAEDLVGETAVRVPSPAPPELVVRLERGGTIEGEVVDALGRPIEGATVRFVGSDLRGQPVDDDPRVFAFRLARADYNVQRPFVQTASSGELGVVPGPVPPIPRMGISSPASETAPAAGDERAEPWVSRRNGRFTAHPVTPGRVFAIVRHPEFLPGQSEWIELAPEARKQVRIVLERGGNVEGVVVDARGQPVAGALVQLASARDGRQVVAASDGTFAFAAVASPAVLLGALPDAPDEIVGRAEVMVPEGGTQKVTLTLDEARDPITVHVVDERGHSVEFAQVTASSISAAVQRKTTGFTDARGEAELRGLRGLALTLEALAPGYAPELLTVDAAEASVRIALTPSERIEGEVRADRGGMVAGARVTLETAGGTRTVLTDADGHYALGDLHPGAVSVRVRADGYAEGHAKGIVRNERGRRASEMPRVSLDEEASASGVVVDEAGQPVPGARVAEGSVPVVLAGDKLPSRVVLTDRAGQFKLGQLRAGRVLLDAYAAGVGRGSAVGVLTERGREVRDVRIVLSRGDGDSPRAAPGSYGVAVTLGESAGEVVLVQVAEGSLAEQAGLRVHDVIESVQGTRVTTIETARARLDGASAEDVVLRIRSEVDGEERARTLRVRREPVRR